MAAIENPAEWTRAWDRNEGRLINLVTVILVIVAAAAFVRPIGGSGLPLLILILLVINAAVTAVRLVPERMLGEAAAAAVLAVGILASAILLAVDLTGFAFGFVGIAAGHAGFRLRPRWALTLGVVAGVLFVIALVVAPRIVGETWPWYFGLLAGLPVLVGLYNRNRALSLRNARNAAEQAIRAAGSEARESALAERARIAREIHDVLAHSLSGVTMQLELADALLDGGSIDKPSPELLPPNRMWC